jgi:DnaJ-class molecular chaperone
MEIATSVYKEEVITCPTCNGKGTTTYYTRQTQQETTNPLSVGKCNTCNGIGKMEQLIVTTTIFKTIKSNKT